MDGVSVQFDNAFNNRLEKHNSDSKNLLRYEMESDNKHTDSSLHFETENGSELKIDDAEQRNFGTEVNDTIASDAANDESEVTTSVTCLLEEYDSQVQPSMSSGNILDDKEDKISQQEQSDDVESIIGQDSLQSIETNDSNFDMPSKEPNNINNMVNIPETEEVKHQVFKTNGGNDEKKVKRRHSKKRKNPDELLKCIICGRYGLTSEFCASGRFCSQRCVGAYASKCRADNLAAAAAAGETIEHKKKRKSKKDGKKGSGRKPSSTVYGTDKMGRFSPDFDDPMSPCLSAVSSSSEETRQKRAKLSLSDDAYLFYSMVGKEKPFEWEFYLAITGKQSVPEDVFIQENSEFDLYPTQAKNFKPGMKLEAVDPRHPSCICVVSVVETQGARLRLHFDGWSESYDFWTNCDSHFLFFAGWCEQNQQKLHAPRGIAQEDFNWERYLCDTKSEAAPQQLFREVPETTHKFKTNMKLEAVDKKNPDLTCVASITNVIGEYFLVHFDEWDDTYDYWCKEDCPYLHGIGWCLENGIRLTPPQDDQVDTFQWHEYLRQTNSIAVPNQLLKKRKPTRFEIGQKLEAVDPRNPSLVRVATVSQLDNFQLKIHFDGWDDMYDFWFDSACNDLHPIGWCEKTSHPLESPPSFLEAQDTTLCPTPGCRGIGHVKGAKYTTHHSIFGCPYSPHNVSRGSPLVDRLANNSMVEEPSISSRVYNCKTTINIGEEASPDSTTKSELIKQQKLLKGIVGRPAKKPSEKTPCKPTKLFGKGFSKFSCKDKSKAISGSPQFSNVTSTSTDNGEVNHKKPRLSIGKIQNGSQRESLRLETSEIRNWTVRDVAEFIRSIGLVEHSMNFEEQQIDGQALLLLSQADMIHHMKIKLGPALKITNAVSKL